MNQETTLDVDRFEQWAIVDLFGHTRLAGLITEQTIGGCSFVRIDIPAVGTKQAHTKLYGNGATYGITFVSEEVAKLAAERFQPEPITEWDLPDKIRKLVHDQEEF